MSDKQRQALRKNQKSGLSALYKNTVEILNPDKLYLSDRQSELAKFDFVLLKFTDETDTGEVLEMYLDDIKPDGKLTRGLYYRGVQ